MSKICRAILLGLLFTVIAAGTSFSAVRDGPEVDWPGIDWDAAKREADRKSTRLNSSHSS